MSSPSAFAQKPTTALAPTALLDNATTSRGHLREAGRGGAGWRRRGSPEFPASSRWRRAANVEVDKLGIVISQHRCRGRRPAERVPDPWAERVRPCGPSEAACSSPRMPARSFGADIGDVAGASADIRLCATPTAQRLRRHRRSAAATLDGFSPRCARGSWSRHDQQQQVTTALRLGGDMAHLVSEA
jgi:hypothetical protein